MLRNCARHLNTAAFAAPALVMCLALLSGCSTVAPTNPLTALTPADADAEKTLSDNEIESVFQAALEDMKNAEWQHARKRLETVTGANPQLAGAWVNLGITQVMLGESGAAEQSLREAIAVNGAHAEAYNQLGMLLRRDGRLQEAQAMYNAAIEANPAHAHAHWNLGILHDRYLPDPAASLAHYEQYQALTGSDDSRLQSWIAAQREQLPPPAEAPVTVAAEGKP